MDGPHTVASQSSLLNLATHASRATSRSELFDMLTAHVVDLVGADSARVIVPTGPDQGERRTTITATTGSATEICVPVRGAQGCYCVVCLTWPTLLGDTAPIAATLEQVADFLAAQFERIDRRESVERSLAAHHGQQERMKLMRDLEAGLSASETLDDVLNVMASIVNDFVDAPRASFMHIVDDSHALVHQIGAGSSDTVPQVVRRDEIDGLRDGQPFVYHPDISGLELAPFPTLYELGIRSSLKIGVFVEHRLIGTLNIGAAEVDGLSPDDRSMLLAAASFMGSTLERIRAHERLEHEAQHDQLTGLLRRSGFERAARAEIDRLREMPGESSVIAFFDVDKFKLVNDTDGHQAGDRVLAEIARRVATEVGDTDVLSRIGGDEFVVLLRHADLDHYVSLCDRIVKCVSSRPFVANTRMLNAAISLGYVSIDSGTSSLKSALARADAACYRAKASGGNCALAAGPDDNANETGDVMPLLRMVRDAASADSFELLGQPIVESRTGLTAATEVFLRLSDDEGNTVLPGRFLPVAERHSAVESVDLWVLEHSLAVFAAAAETGRIAPYLYLNVSTASTTSNDFSARSAELIAAAGVRPAQICFEIDESGVVREYEATLAFAMAMSELGAQIAVGNFGLSGATLAHLRHFPIDVLKIDGELVRALDTDPTALRLVRAAHELGRALGALTVAESIENERTYDAVTRLGVDLVQGHHLGGLVPLEQCFNPSVPTLDNSVAG